MEAYICNFFVANNNGCQPNLEKYAKIFTVSDSLMIIARRRVSTCNIVRVEIKELHSIYS